MHATTGKGDVDVLNDKCKGFRSGFDFRRELYDFQCYTALQSYKADEWDKNRVYCCPEGLPQQPAILQGDAAESKLCVVVAGCTGPMKLSGRIKSQKSAAQSSMQSGRKSADGMITASTTATGSFFASLTQARPTKLTSQRLARLKLLCPPRTLEASCASIIDESCKVPTLLSARAPLGSLFCAFGV